MGRHISDNHTICRETYYVHPQSDHTLFLDTLSEASMYLRTAAVGALVFGMTADRHT